MTESTDAKTDTKPDDTCKECDGVGHYVSRSLGYLTLTHDTRPFQCSECGGTGKAR